MPAFTYSEHVCCCFILILLFIVEQGMTSIELKMCATWQCVVIIICHTQERSWCEMAREFNENDRGARTHENDLCARWRGSRARTIEARGHTRTIMARDGVRVFGENKQGK